MKLTSRKTIFWVYILTLVVGSVVVYLAVQFDYVTAYDAKGFMVPSVIALLGMIAMQLIYLYFAFKKKIDWRKLNLHLVGGTFITMICSFASYLLYALYLLGVDHSTIKSYDYVWNYDTQSNEQVIKIGRADLNIAGLSAHTVINVSRSGKSSIKRRDTTTYFALPIIESVENPAVVGWLLSLMDTRDYSAIYESGNYASLVDFAAIKGFIPIDLSKDHFYAEIVSKSPFYDSVGASKPAFYASYNLPPDRPYFLWYTMAAYIITVFGFRYAAKIISKIEDLY